MLYAGYSPETEPYLFKTMQIVKENSMKSIKERCRILVPNSRILLGVCDQSGILKYGQCYLRVSYGDDSQQVIVGKGEFVGDFSEIKIIVAVCKNPCTHPGGNFSG